MNRKLTMHRPEGDVLITLAASWDQWDDHLENIQSILHPQEIFLLNKFETRKAKANFFAGRYAAKQAIYAYIGREDYAGMLIQPGVFGQPVLKMNDTDNLQVSISHSNGCAMALAFPEIHPMGIDVELIFKEDAFLSNGVISESEHHFLDMLNPDKLISNTLLWTIKEALSKVLRTGLMTPFHFFEICDVRHYKNVIISEFVHFPQYKSLSWIAGKYSFSIVSPKNSTLDLEVLNTVQNELSATFSVKKKLSVL